jgi:hypothetical protein
MSATLSKIRTKVRRLTRSLSDNQITNAQIDEYVDDFFLYDFPEQLKLNALHQTFTWTCSPYIDTYLTNANASVNALVNFNQNYIALNKPVFIGGQAVNYYQDETEFYNTWPKIQTQVNIGTGDGVTEAFTYTLSNRPIAQNSVLISAVDGNYDKLAATDDPINTAQGYLLDTETGANLGSINYQTGVINITFASAPIDKGTIQAQFFPYVASMPSSVLYFQDKFVLRPVPDRPYEITLEVFRRPSSLGNDANATPQLEQWWQYLAYGAAKKIFEDRSDMESVQGIMPEFKQQESLVLYRTVQQQGTQRSYTIYANQVENVIVPWSNRNYWY